MLPAVQTHRPLRTFSTIRNVNPTKEALNSLESVLSLQVVQCFGKQGPIKMLIMAISVSLEIEKRARLAAYSYHNHTALV